MVNLGCCSILPLESAVLEHCALFLDDRAVCIREAGFIFIKLSCLSGWVGWAFRH
jgi:hypothetical protein